MLDARTDPAPVQNAATPQARFHRHECGSIVEPNRGLEWFVGPDETLSYGATVRWAEELQACDGGWRMPTQEELLPLFDANHNAGSGFASQGQRFVAHLDPLFAGIGGGSWVWAASSATGPNSIAINFNIRKEVSLPRDQEKYTVRAFAVRTAGASVSAKSAQDEPDIRVVHAGASASVLSGSPVVAITEPDIREAGLGTATKESIRLVLEARLLSHAGVTVVADSRLRAELQQRKRNSYEECYDQSCQIDLGKAVAARMLLSSRIIREPGPLCSLSLRLLDLQSETARASVFVQSHSECGPKVAGALAVAAAAALSTPTDGSSPGQGLAVSVESPASSGGEAARNPVAPLVQAETPSEVSIEEHYSQELEEELRCFKNPDPGTVIRDMLLAGLLRATGHRADGIPVLETTKEIRVFGAKVLFVQGWQRESDYQVRHPFSRGPGTAPPLFLEVRLDARLEDVRYRSRVVRDSKGVAVGPHSHIEVRAEYFDSVPRVSIVCYGHG